MAVSWHGHPHGMRSQVAETPSLHSVAVKTLHILVETLPNVAHPTRCRQPLNSARLLASYIVYKEFFTLILCMRGGPATCNDSSPSAYHGKLWPLMATAISYEWGVTIARLQSFSRLLLSPKLIPPGLDPTHKV